MANTETLIIGCGIAGATAALRLARNPERQVTIITRASEIHESNTRYAQGGIIGRGPDDTSQLLFEDIVAAGAGVTFPTAARILADEGPPLLNDVLERIAGVVFDHTEEGTPVWGQEAAHSRRRILHVGDTTGLAIMSGLVAALKKYPNIKIKTEATAVDLITFPHHSRNPLDNYREISCHGCYVFDRTEKTVHRYLASATILATGGLGRIYRNTTNPVGARGDGLAMAHRAGARIANAEYVQFHPTALAVPGAEGLLISEAVRGEGGVLLTPDLRPFMERYSPQWKDLAPRDVVARAIHHEMEAHGYSHVLLDIASHMPAEAIRGRFPFIYDACLKVGVDVS
ncbi:MAG TPA: FAD-dependent oxidoreductase, partial [Pyrinomonadaceae bacterium]|nr:FAD-dependent oxidoreductase [Pyrinomonadaceae bacterium]